MRRLSYNLCFSWKDEIRDLFQRIDPGMWEECDEEKIEAFKGTVSLPFAKGENSKIAVKIIDDRGIESLKGVSL